MAQRTRSPTEALPEDSDALMGPSDSARTRPLLSAHASPLNRLALLGAAAGLAAALAVVGAALSRSLGVRSTAARSAMRGGALPAQQQEVLLGTTQDDDKADESFGEPVDDSVDRMGKTAEMVAAELEEDKKSSCAASGESCLASRCCKEPGFQCFTKDAYWAQCLPECSPGPNVLDQSSPQPWECKALGNRTPGTLRFCSGDGEDCRATKCCTAGGTQCVRKNEFWAMCRGSCTPGPDLREKDYHPWSCEALGPRTLGAAPWIEKKCAWGGEACAAKGCCAEPGKQCYKQSPWYSKCRDTCTPGMKDSPWEHEWSCEKVGMRTPDRIEGKGELPGMVSDWVRDRCSPIGANCLESMCCQAVGHQCYRKDDYWATCEPSCKRMPGTGGNKTWDCEKLGPRSWGLAVKGYPSLYCISLFMPSGYEGPLLKSHIEEGAGIFACDGYDIFAAEEYTLGRSKDGVDVSAIRIPNIPVGRSQDGTAGNAKLFMAVWDKVIAGNRFRNYDFTLKVDPDAVVIPWRIRGHMRPHIGAKAYVVNCNKFPNSPNFPMMFGAVEIFSGEAMNAYALGSWKCGKQLPWAAWGEDYYMTHCLDYLGVARINDFGVLGDNVCTGANCADGYTGSYHPFKSIGSWMQCWGQATK